MSDDLCFRVKLEQQFEDFCVVSDSIRQGIRANVEIFDAAGQRVYGAGDSASADPG